MKNELGRKITSLTLMTIMFAGGMTFAIPEMMPEAVADESCCMFQQKTHYLVTPLQVPR